MPSPVPDTLSRRERQVLDSLYRLRTAAVADLVDATPGRPSYAAVRAALRTLREKGLVRFHVEGPRYIYMPVLAPERARRRALEHVVRTFFDGSPAAAAAALLGMEGVELPDDALERLQGRIAEARKEGR